MRYLTRQIVPTKSVQRLTLLALSLMVAGCANQTNHSASWPTNLNVIELSDGGICLDADGAKQLAELKAELEAL